MTSCNRFRAWLFWSMVLVGVLPGCNGKTKKTVKSPVSAELSTVEAGAAKYEVQEEAFFAEIKVTVRDSGGEPLPGVLMEVIPDGELVQVEPAEGVSDASGQAEFTATTRSMGTVRFDVRAKSGEGEVAVQLEQVAEVEFVAGLTVEETAEADYRYDTGVYAFRLTLTDGTGPVDGALLTGLPEFNGVEILPDSLVTDAVGQAEFVAETLLRGEQSLLLALAGVSPVLSVQVNLPEFGHGSVRPSCQYDLDTSRVPYYGVPVVVAADWGEPVQVSPPVTDVCPNDAIELSPDGERLYFFWSPTVNGSHQEVLHITTGTYVAERVGTDPGLFSAPRFFDLQKGAGGSVDGALSFTPDGAFVYFHSTRSDNLGYQADPPTNDFLDIYVAEVIDGEPGPAVNLGEPVNSIYLDGEHALHPDGTELFLSSDRPGGQGGIDIWVTQYIAGVWTMPVNPGPPLNTEYWEGQPGFSAADPDTMYFVSNRDGPSAIYRTTRTGNTWSVPELVITGYVGEPSFTAAGDILYFVHVLVDDQGVFGSSIWYVRRNQ